MSSTRRCLATMLCLTVVHATANQARAEDELIEPLQPYVAEVVASFDEISDERRELLDEMAALIRERLQAGEEVSITYICTANSRRSHLSQVWAQTAIGYYGVSGVSTFSGGTEATACNIRTVRAFRRAGYSVTRTTDGDNPHYLIQYSDSLPPIDAYSKVYDCDENPSQGFLAAMVCSDADANCPVVEGSFARIALGYEDPKVADNTPEESARYDERCRQIAIEQFYLMSRVREP